MDKRNLAVVYWSTAILVGSIYVAIGLTRPYTYISKETEAKRLNVIDPYKIDDEYKDKYAIEYFKTIMRGQGKSEDVINMADDYPDLIVTGAKYYCEYRHPHVYKKENEPEAFYNGLISDVNWGRRTRGLSFLSDKEESNLYEALESSHQISEYYCRNRD